MLATLRGERGGEEDIRDLAYCVKGRAVSINIHFHAVYKAVTSLRGTK